jgi:ABC-type Na+ efflux pump permease subunit
MDFYNNTQEKPITIGEWIVTFILTAIPIVGFIMLLVWAFGSNTPTTKANWAKASLIMMVIGIVLGFLLIGSIAALIGSIGHS